MNKIFILILITLSFNSQAELFFKDKQNGNDKIEIYQIGNLRVNDFCKDNRENCIKYIFNKIKNKKIIKNDSHVAVHPASHNCSELNGKSDIFYDKNNNQYDFCIFENGIIIDSWDLYNRFK